MPMMQHSPSPLEGEGGARSAQPSGRVRGLSAQTQQLWLAAVRHRKLADAIGADTCKTSQ